MRTGGAPSETDDRPRPDAATVPGGPPWPSAHPIPTSTATSRRQRLGPRVRDVRRLRPADLRRADDVHEAAVGHRSGRAPRARASTSRSSARRSTTPSATGPAPASGPRAIREAQYTSGSINSLQLGVEPFEVLDRRRRRRREHRPGLDRARPRADLPQGPRGRRDRRDPDRARRRPLDHLAVARPRSPRSAGPGSIGIVHFDAHADTANDDWGVLAGHGTPMRRLIESGAVNGRNFVQVGLRGYWPPVDDVRVDAGAGPALALHARDRGARRRGGHRRRDRRGARRPGRDLPQPRHRRHRPGHGARAPARPSRAGC